MKQLPTAEEFLWNGTIITQGDTEPYGRLPNDKVSLVMIEFAKLHVQAALNAACESDGYDIDQDSVLNAYPLDNIK